MGLTKSSFMEANLKQANKNTNDILLINTEYWTIQSRKFTIKNKNKAGTINTGTLKLLAHTPLNIQYS